MTENISSTVDDDVYEFLQQDHINISGLVNRCLREYMNTGGDVSAVRDLRIRQLKDDANDLENRAQNKRERAMELEEELEATKNEEQADELQAVLNKAEYIPADPTHPFVLEHASDLTHTPKELADEIADQYNKQRQTNNDDTDGLNSL